MKQTCLFLPEQGTLTRVEQGGALSSFVALLELMVVRGAGGDHFGETVSGGGSAANTTLVVHFQLWGPH